MLPNISAMNTPDTLIFLHIPKTAGTTVSVVLKGWYSPHELFHIRSGEHSAAPRFSTNFGPETHFRSLLSDERAQYRCIMGHTKFGLHEVVPGRAKYFTLLRNPLERYISQVAQYNRMIRGGEFGPESQPVSLYEFRSLKSLQFTNPQTRWLTGLSGEKFLRRDDSSLLQQAKDNVDQWFSVVGVVEQIEMSLAVLAYNCGRTMPSIKRENSSTERPSIEDFTASQLQEFEENNRLDKELWQFASERLQLQAANLCLPSESPLQKRVVEPIKRIARRLRFA
jgi:hypothetical protein